MSDTDKPLTRPLVIDDVPWEAWSEGAHFGSRVRPLGKAGGGSHVGVLIEELAPGQCSCPAHYHMLEEEHVLMLEGEATLRIGAQRYRFKAGEYVCFPAGQRAAHNLTNESDRPCRFLIIGEHNPHDVMVYPDSDKINVRLAGALFRHSATLDYWSGERDDGPA